MSAFVETRRQTERIHASLLILGIILRRFSPREEVHSRFILFFLKYCSGFLGSFEGNTTVQQIGAGEGNIRL